MQCNALKKENNNNNNKERKKVTEFVSAERLVIDCPAAKFALSTAIRMHAHFYNLPKQLSKHISESC